VDPIHPILPEVSYPPTVGPAPRTRRVDGDERRDQRGRRDAPPRPQPGGKAVDGDEDGPGAYGPDGAKQLPGSHGDGRPHIDVRT